MDMHELTRELKVPSDSKIVLLVADGLGDLPLEPGGKTPLETAATPNLDELAVRGILGGSIPVKPGITPGSGPGHLGLFGYDPLTYRIGRGALEATGIGFHLTDRDVAVRGNFCTLDAAGKISDRRAGRIATEKSAPLAERLREVKIPGIEVFVEPVKEHRFVAVFRGDGLGGHVEDTDPQATGVPPLKPKAANAESQRTAEVAADFVSQACKLLADEKQANGLTLRGFARKPDLPSYEEVYGLKAAAIAVYPMYKGLARLVGMDIVGQAQTLGEQIDVLQQEWNNFDFFFIHFKYTDSTGEDGNFDSKVKRIEELDAVIPRVTGLDPTVLIVTGDHSTPALLKSHSWHPVPMVLVSKVCRTDRCTSFGENEAIAGGLGQFEAKYLMPLALANAGRLTKFGA
ncbi:MAG: 2,3-bisphosphoglycerate-independent phosphoglycerate mutase [Planctomycetota bacterium]|nr:MAG: 2,3-bisphosphoglycerate-independent phosphoglycerate mutase [Planctomycetota bacterium]